MQVFDRTLRGVSSCVGNARGLQLTPANAAPLIFLMDNIWLSLVASYPDVRGLQTVRSPSSDGPILT